jgi:signal transduction histidine kinase/CheY-like chemotaxis protein
MRPVLKPTKNEKADLSKWTLFFADKKLEEQYRNEHFVRSLLPFQVSFVMVTFLYAAFGIFDLQTSQEFLREFLVIRYFIVVPLMAVICLLSLFSFFRKQWQLLISICYVVGGCGIAFMLLANPNNLWYYGGMFLIFMAGYFLIKLHFLWAVISGTCVLLFYNLSPVFLDMVNFNSGHIVISNAFFISSNIIAAVAVYNSQKIERNEFFQRMLMLSQQNHIKRINATLEEKVNTRTKLLENKNKDLYLEIDNRKKAEEKLLHALNKAEESEKLKSAFLTNLSHEIRTPMNGIIGFLDLITDPELSNDEKEQFFDIIKQSGNRLLTTITDIVEISRIQAGEISVSDSEVELEQLFTYLKDSLTLELKFKNLQLNTPDWLPCKSITTDSSKLQSILQNLVNNAIKFSGNGTISMGIEAQNQHLKFWVKDTGKGIPTERHEAIFESFVQADTGFSRGYEGSGLGLTICKAYVECLGGKIWLESKPNEGSTFYFTIDYNPVKFKTINERGDTTKNTNEKSKNSETVILVAEDDDVSFNLLETLLLHKTDSLMRAKNGKEAVELFRQNEDKISLVFMDIKMPVMDGIEATRQIRNKNNKIPLIAQTAFALSGDREVALNAGCNDYLSKPLKLHDVLAIVKKYA